MRAALSTSVVGLGLALSAVNAQAQTPAEFYKGKTIEMHIGYSSGGGYDVYGRIVARHMGRHIPGNPQIVPKNTPGAGSLRAANWLYCGSAQGRHGDRPSSRAAPHSIRCSA